MLRKKANRGIRTMATTYYERGFQEGERHGLRRALKKLLEGRFGPLSPEVRQRLEKLTDKQLDKVLLAGYKAQSLRELGLEK
jgi:hypothetical protein